MNTYTFIIPCFNSSATLVRTIESIKAQIFQSTPEIIVVDNNSTDHTCAVAEELGIKVIKQTTQGSGVARNLGARMATGTHLVFIDSDVEIGRDWLTGLDRLYQTCPWIQIVSASLIPARMHNDQLYLLRRYLLEMKSSGYGNLLAANPPVLNSALFSTSKNTFVYLGGFSEDLLRLEDSNLGNKALSLSCNMMVYDAEAKVYFETDSMMSYLLRSFTIGQWAPFAIALNGLGSLLRISQNSLPTLEILRLLNNLFFILGFLFGYSKGRRLTRHRRRPAKNDLLFNFSFDKKHFSLNAYISLIFLKDQIIAYDFQMPLYNFRGPEKELLEKITRQKSHILKEEELMLFNWVQAGLFKAG